MRFDSKYLDIFFSWHCKPNGGLFFGLKLQFPFWMSGYEIDNQAIVITIGLIFFSINVYIKYNHKKVYY